MDIFAVGFQLQHLPVQGKSLLIILLGEVYVRKMTHHCRILIHKVMCPLKLLYSFVVPLQFVQHPAEAVENEPVIRTQAHCLAKVLQGLVQVRAEFGIGVPEVIKGLGIIGDELDHLFHPGDRFFLFPHLVQQYTNAEDKPRILGE